MAEHASEVHCLSPPATFATSILCGVFSVFTDWYSVTLPAILLLRLRITARQKYGLLFIFGMGYMYVSCPNYSCTNTRDRAAGAGIARTYYLGRIQVEVDKYWYAFEVEAASIAEVNIAIICACAPSLNSIAGRFFKSRGSKNSLASVGKPSDQTSQATRTDTGAPDNISATSFALQGYSSRIKRYPFGARNGFIKDPSSFANVHKHGLDGSTPIAEGYEGYDGK
jgi:hypothetical protein